MLPPLSGKCDGRFLLMRFTIEDVKVLKIFLSLCVNPFDDALKHKSCVVKCQRMVLIISTTSNRYANVYFLDLIFPQMFERQLSPLKYYLRTFIFS